LLLLIGVAYQVVPTFQITPPCALLIAAPWRPELAIGAGSVLARSAFLLWINLIAATRRDVRHGGRLIKP
jgi:hypothetical protein